MSTFLADIAPFVPALLLTALFVWALERNHRRQHPAPWADDYRHPAEHDADHRRSAHDWDAVGVTLRRVVDEAAGDADPLCSCVGGAHGAGI